MPLSRTSDVYVLVRVLVVCLQAVCFRHNAETSEYYLRSYSTVCYVSYSNGVQVPQNKGKGGKNRRRGKNEGDDDKRELVFKEDGQGTEAA